MEFREFVYDRLIKDKRERKNSFKMYPHETIIPPILQFPFKPGTPIIVIFKLLFYPQTENNCNQREVLLKIIVSTWSILLTKRRKKHLISLPHLKRRSFWWLEITGNWSNKKHHSPPPFSNRCTVEISLPAMIYCNMTDSLSVFPSSSSQNQMPRIYNLFN